MLAQPLGIEWELGSVFKWEEVLMEMVVEVELAKKKKKELYLPMVSAQ